MASLAQIPTDLLNAKKYHDFLNWVFTYPISWSNTRAFIMLWSRACDRKIKASDWSAIETRWIHNHARS